MDEMQQATVEYWSRKAMLLVFLGCYGVSFTSLFLGWNIVSNLQALWLANLGLVIHVSAMTKDSIMEEVFDD